MRKLIAATGVATVMLAAGMPAMAQGDGGILSAKNFSSTITLSTDYQFRGITNTTHGPAIQGSFDWGYKGFYLGVWGSNTDFGVGESMEVDYYGGYDWSWSGLDFDVSGLYYSYPGHASSGANGLGATPNYAEAHFGASHTFSNVTFTPTVGVDYNYSPAWYGEDGEAHYVQGTLSFALPKDFTLHGLAGWQTVAGDKTTTGYEYGNWLIGLGKTLAGFNFDLSYHDTWHTVGACGGTTLCDGDVMFSISHSM